MTSKISTKNNSAVSENKVSASIIYRRVPPEKKKKLKKIIKEIAKKHGVIVNIIEKK